MDEDQTVLIYSQPGARIRNISRNPKVTLNFGGDGKGGDIVVLSGTAEVVQSETAASDNPAWVRKYADDWKHGGMTAESFAQRFSAPVKIQINEIHGR